MVQAINGMVHEQKQVLFSFILMMFVFALQLIGMYWIMMDQISAIVSSLITVGGMYIWYHYCLRIYNRFYWDQSKADNWQGLLDVDEGQFADLDELAGEPTEEPSVEDIISPLSVSPTAQGGKPSYAKSETASIIGESERGKSGLLKSLLDPEEAVKKETQVKRGSSFSISSKSDGRT